MNVMWIVKIMIFLGVRFLTAGLTFTGNYIPKQTISHTHEWQVLTSHDKIQKKNLLCSPLDNATIKMCQCSYYYIHVTYCDSITNTNWLFWMDAIVGYHENHMKQCVVNIEYFNNKAGYTYSKHRVFKDLHIYNSVHIIY